MGSERGLWKTVHKNMQGKWEAQRIENVVGPGTPDLYYTLNSGTMGWLELKYEPEWPKKKDTVLTVNSYTPQQKNWFRKHGSKGANIFMLLQVEKEYFLFDWEGAVNDVNFSPRFILIVKCIKYWKSKINFNEFVEIIEEVS